MIFQLEEAVGVTVSSIGLGGCSVRSQQHCGSAGCWLSHKISPFFNLVDANSTSLAGPGLSLTFSCGCRPPTQTHSNATPIPATLGVMDGRLDKDCHEDTCLNGGKCLPDHDGPRYSNS